MRNVLLLALVLVLMLTFRDRICLRSDTINLQNLSHVGRLLIFRWSEKLISICINSTLARLSGTFKCHFAEPIRLANHILVNTRANNSLKWQYFQHWFNFKIQITHTDRLHLVVLFKHLYYCHTNHKFKVFIWMFMFVFIQCVYTINNN